jgi:hypothetical protein
MEKVSPAHGYHFDRDSRRPRRPRADTRKFPGPLHLHLHARTDARGHPYQNDLHSVSASSPADIWAVGQTGIHFDGTKWTAFFLPKIVGDNTSKLEESLISLPITSGPLDLAASLSAMAIKSSGISMVPGGASSPIPSFSPPTSPPWNP